MLLFSFCGHRFDICKWQVRSDRSEEGYRDMFRLPTFSKSVRRFLASHVKQHQPAAFLPRSQICRGGKKNKPTFSTQEMNRRLTALRKHMTEERLDACVFTSHHNISYFGNFLYVAFGRPYGYIVTMDKAISVTPGVDSSFPWRQTFGDNITYTDWQKDNFFHVIRQEVANAKHVGLELDNVHIDNYKKFSDALPDTKFIDIGRSTMRMRMIKSAEEIDLIKNASRIAEKGGAEGIKAIRENVPEYEVALACNEAMIREIATTYPHIELRDTWTNFMSGINTDGAHNLPSTRRVQKGDILSINCFPMIAGYYVAFERTLFFDHVPSDRHMELWEINSKVHRRGIELVQPGARCSDIALELNEMFLEHNLLQYRTVGYGHSFGVLCHYYGREGDAELREDVDTILQPNMVMSMEPMITIPDGEPGAGGYRDHNIVVITETGGQDITTVPYGPQHCLIKS